MSQDQQPGQDQPKKAPGSDLTVAGIGASAGGLAALKTFFERVPSESGLAFVVVVHLSPEHESRLADLLQNYVHFPVQQVTETTRLEPNRVYVIPPNANISAVDTHLRLTKLEELRSQRAPIDHFFRTLANTYDGQAVGVILSGTGSDGTLGIKDIKAKGGLVMVQDPGDAEYDGMPQSAIATGLADIVLPVGELPDAMLRFERTQPRVSVPAKDEDLAQTENLLLLNIFAELRARTGRDFSRYKRSTIMRRIARRMQLNHIEDLPTYVDRLPEHPEEARALADDLLITVTSFFRDADAFEKLEKEVLPRIFAGKDATSDPIRVWSVGCATGEEAYSLAMLLVEQAHRHDSPPRIQILASDLHKGSLDKAREGYYSGDIQADVSPARLKNFFQKENGGYRIQKEIRDLVLFAQHNILADPPFSHLDLISCRNLLMYLERGVQRDVIELFHYALNAEGTLLLGSSESLEVTDLFRAEDQKLNLFQKRNVPVTEPRLPVFPLNRIRRVAELASQVEQLAEPARFGKLHQRMVELYAPPSVLVSPDNKLVHVSEHGGRYLIYPGGAMTADVLKLMRGELRGELRRALDLARDRKQAVDSKPVPVQFDDHLSAVVMHVRPAPGFESEGFALVIFEEREPFQDSPPIAAGDEADESQRVRDLEAQLIHSRQRLLTISQQYETDQEEMKASNEEMLSANEELRSTLEELEVSKEELERINEELQTVNQENRQKVEELAQVSSDLPNLLAASDIATLFLDRDLRILRFTPKLGELFNIRASDAGRPISDLTNRLGYTEMGSDAEGALLRLAPVEREVHDEKGNWYVVRVLPYRTTEHRIVGVNITFIDITNRRKAEQAVRSSEERLKRMTDVDLVGILIFDQNGVIIDSNEAFLEMFGYSREDVSARRLTWHALTPPEYVAESELQMQRLAKTGRIGPYEKEYLRKDGSRSWFLFAGSSLGDGTVAEYCVDVSDRKRAEALLHESKLYAESIIDTLHEPLLVLTQDLRVKSANPAFYSSFAVKQEETVGKLIFELGNGQWNIPALRHLLEETLSRDSVFNDFEVEHNFDSIGHRVMLLNGRRLENLQLILLGIRDITELKRAGRAIAESEERYRLLIENAREYAIFMVGPDGKVVTWNPGAERIFGYAASEIVGQSGAILFAEEDRAAGIPEKEMKTAAEEGKSLDDRWQERKGGLRFWASGVMESFRLPDGSLRFMKVLRDNTEKKQTEDALREHDRELRHLNSALSTANADLKQFAVAASHDLREPLRTVSAYSQLLLDSMKKGREKDAEMAVRFIVEGTGRMDHLLNDLMTYTQINLDEEESSEKVDLNRVLQDALGNLKSKIDETGAQITQDRLPVVQGREAYFMQLLQNLIDNALKYRSEAPPRIHIGVERADGDWRLSVRDNGCGIGPQYHEQIFRVFNRLHGSQIPGTGFGLAICRRVVERSGGRIWVESEKGKGATFYFTLPAIE